MRWQNNGVKSEWWEYWGVEEMSRQTMGVIDDNEPFPGPCGFIKLKERHRVKAIGKKI